MLKKALAFLVSLFAWRSGCLQSSGGFGLRERGGTEHGMRGVEGKGEREGGGVTMRRNTVSVISGISALLLWWSLCLILQSL